MAKQSKKKGPADVTGQPIEDQNLKEVVGGVLSKLSKTASATCTCASCGLSNTIKVSNSNAASDPES